MTQETQECCPFQRASTLKQAAELALADEGNGDAVFKFARALRSFELTTGVRVPESELRSAFNVWWKLAESTLDYEPDYDETFYLFCDTFPRVLHPLGANVIQSVLNSLGTTEEPPEAEQYQSPKLRRLVHFCCEMQKQAGDKPFYLGVRDAARVIETKKLETAGAFLNGLVRDGVLRLVNKGTAAGRKASTFYYGSKEQPEV